MKRSVFTLFFDAVNVIALLRSGLPVLLIAPTGGGKTTIIKIAEKVLKEEGITLSLERVTIKRLYKLAKVLNKTRVAYIFSDDWTTIGENDIAESVINIVSKLAYDKRYHDPLYNLNINLQRLGYVVGVQPYYLQVLINREYWDTMVAEKIIRYYMLPISIINYQRKYEEIVDNVIEEIKKRQRDDVKTTRKLVKIVENALEEQVGGRAVQYSQTITRNVLCSGAFNKTWWIEQFAARLDFESKFINKTLEGGFTNNVLWKEYTILYYVLASKHGLSYREIAKRLKIKLVDKEATETYTSMIVKKAIEQKYVSVFKINGKSIVIPHKRFAFLNRHWTKLYSDESFLSNISQKNVMGVVSKW